MLMDDVLCATGRIHPEPDTSTPMINQECGDTAVAATTCSVYAEDCPHTDNDAVRGTGIPAEQAATIDKLQQQVAAMMRQMELHNIMTSSPSAQLSSLTGNVHQYTIALFIISHELLTHIFFNNVDRSTSSNAPHLKRFDVRTVYMYNDRKRWVYVLDQSTSQLERCTCACKRNRSTFGASHCRAAKLLQCATLPYTLPQQ